MLISPFRLARHGGNLWRIRQLRTAFLDAQTVLGERMYAAGIDDGQLGAKISAVDEQVRRAEDVGASGQALRAERSRLVLQLAAAALEDDGPLPGADLEYAQARKALAALSENVVRPILART
jgi:hypothetical protein